MTKSENTKIIVAAHKPYKMPEDKIYLPLHVGAALHQSFDFQDDNTGDNISSKNPYYCELTGLYWAWKNLDCEYAGLVHYRRHFSVKKFIPHSEEKKFNCVLNSKELDKLLDKTDVILPKKRNYFIENIYDHYKHTLYVEPLDIAGEIIKEKYPEYYKAFENQKKTTKMHAFNMFIMKKSVLNKYCTWLFDILGEVEKRVDSSQYSDFHKRFYGRLSELLLDVWIYTNNIQFKEIKVIDMQHVNWIKKGFSF